MRDQVPPSLFDVNCERLLRCFFGCTPELLTQGFFDSSSFPNLLLFKSHIAVCCEYYSSRLEARSMSGKSAVLSPAACGQNPVQVRFLLRHTHEGIKSENTDRVLIMMF